MKKNQDRQMKENGASRCSSGYQLNAEQGRTSRIALHHTVQGIARTGWCVDKLDRAQKLLGLRFSNQDLLKEALTHRSFLLEKKVKSAKIYERLEFLGDAVLNLAVTDFIFRRFPKFSEGDLAKLRANLVNTEVLATLARKLKIGGLIYLSKGESKEGGDKKTSILGDCFEAIVGAIYLDKGIDTAEKFVLKQLKSEIIKQAKREEFSDAKTALQEYAASRFSSSPVYQVVSEKGPVHKKTFFVEVKLKNKVWAKGKGPSKKKAELAAATQALKVLKR